MAFGVYPEISLADARSKREEARKLVAAGIDLVSINVKKSRRKRLLL
jgi:hypothetical protein